MLAPGMTISSGGRVAATIGAGTVPDFFNQGVGFMTDGSLAIDTDAPTGSVYRNGVRQSAAGAFYGTSSHADTDVYMSGIRLSNLGQLCYVSSDADTYVNGNPINMDSIFCVN